MSDLHGSTWQPFYDSLATSYERKVRNFARLFGGHDDFLKYCCDFLAPQPGEALLDACCGTGVLARDLGQQVGPSGNVIGIDFSAAMIEQAQQKASDVVHFSLMDARSLDFPAEYFDGACLILVLHEMAREIRYQVLREIHRVLRPHGRLVVVDHTTSSNLLLRQIQRVLFRLISAPAERGTFADLEVHGVETELKDCGFIIHKPQTLFNAQMFCAVGGTKCD